MSAPNVLHQALDGLWDEMVRNQTPYGEGAARDGNDQTIAVLALNLDPDEIKSGLQDPKGEMEHTSTMMIGIGGRRLES